MGTVEKFMVKEFTESQHHTWLGWRHLCVPLCPPAPRPGGCWRCAGSSPQPLSGQPGPGLRHPPSTDVLLGAGGASRAPGWACGLRCWAQAPLSRARPRPLAPPCRAMGELPRSLLLSRPSSPSSRSLSSGQGGSRPCRPSGPCAGLSPGCPGLSPGCPGLSPLCPGLTGTGGPALGPVVQL